MAEKRIGAVAVIEGGKTLGLVTGRDLVYNVLAKGGTRDFPLAKAMRRDLPIITPDTTEVECSDMMRVHFARRVLGGRMSKQSRNVRSPAK